MCLLRRFNQLEEKSKGVVDRSSTVIAKEPEGTFYIWLWSDCVRRLLQIFSFTSHTKIKQKKHTHTHTKHKETQTKNICRSWGFVFDSFWFDLIRLSHLTPPTNDWKTRLDARNPYRYSSYLEIKNKSPKETKRCTTWHSTTIMDFELTRGHVYRWRYGRHLFFDFPLINLLVLKTIFEIEEIPTLFQ